MATADDWAEPKVVREQIAMMRRIRTSRPLEYACGHNLDFLWLAEGLLPDHATLAEFFSKHPQPLKSFSTRPSWRCSTNIPKPCRPSIV